MVIVVLFCFFVFGCGADTQPPWTSIYSSLKSCEQSTGFLLDLFRCCMKISCHTVSTELNGLYYTHFVCCVHTCVLVWKSAGSILMTLLTWVSYLSHSTLLFIFKAKFLAKLTILYMNCLIFNNISCTFSNFQQNFCNEYM